MYTALPDFLFKIPIRNSRASFVNQFKNSVYPEALVIISSD